MAARGGWKSGNRPVGRSRGQFLDRGRCRRLFSPAPEPLEDRMLLASVGSLDPAFGRAGLVTTQFGGDDSDSVGALQPDGKIVVAGAVTSPGGADTIGLARYLPDGRLDTTFGSSGTGEVVVGPGVQFDDVSAVAVINRPGQADDGKIVVAGGSTNPTTNRVGVALARFNPNGTLDTTFGSGGAVLDARTTDRAMALAIQADEKIVVSGRTLANANFRGFVERFNPDGTPDSGFANPGVAGAPSGWTLEDAQALAFDANRGLFVAGTDGLHIEVAHLAAAGQLDSSFGSGGIATASAAGGSVSEVDGLAIDSNRGLVVAGTFYGGTPAHFSPAVTRFDFGGNLDPSFNGGRVQLVDSPPELDRASAVAVQPDGKVLLAAEPGSTPESLPSAFALTRLNVDGTKDNGFGTGGSVTTTFPGLTGNRAFNSAAQSVLLQPDGNIVLAGWAGSSFALARYLGSNSLPPPKPQPPVVGPITTPAPVLTNTTVMVSAMFTYNIPTDQHTAVWDWGDHTTSVGNVVEANGQGSVTGSHVYAVPGVYQITVTVTDQRGASGSSTSIPGVVVFDLILGGVTGSGRILSPLGAFPQTPTLAGKASVQLGAKFAANGTPSGKVGFTFKAAHLNFKSTRIDWLVISANTLWTHGTGTINGAGSFSFLVSAGLGGSGSARLRIQIRDQSTGAVVYDSQPGAPLGAAPTTPLSGGRITLHVKHTRMTPRRK
jgi:uncharacterized delta-60 repeat protein